MPLKALRTCENGENDGAQVGGRVDEFPKTNGIFTVDAALRSTSSEISVK
ncbi:MAG: hypothetical protein IJY15_05525 [Thermoguttaceae bacterium]|nr:hypothetical protein [Thermoguttaceae bacterium]